MAESLNLRQLNVLVPPTFLARLKLAAAQHERSQSAEARAALEAWFTQHAIPEPNQQTAA